MPDDCKICRKTSGIGLVIPSKKVTIHKRKQTNVSEMQTDIPNFEFYFEKDSKDINVVPFEKLRINTDNGFFPIREVSGISETDVFRLQKGIRFGWLAEEMYNEDILRTNPKYIKKIKFQAELSLDGSGFEINEFTIISNKLQNFHSRRPEKAEQRKNEPPRYDCKFIAADVNFFSASPKSCSFKDDIFAYQEAIYLYIQHKGFATWKEIKNRCADLVKTSEHFLDFGNHPEYKIFLPLFKIGIIDVFNKNGDYVFCLAPKIPLFDSELKNKYSYRNHFKNSSSEKTQKLNVLWFLRSLPSIKQEITQTGSQLFKSNNDSTEEGFVKFSANSLKNEMRHTKNLTGEIPCIFKYEDKVYMPDYFYLNEGKRFLINREIPDAETLCRAYVNSERVLRSENSEKPFTYYLNDKKLVCDYFPDLPVLYARALILNNPEILKNDELYLSYCYSKNQTENHCEQVFSNVNEEFANALDEKYEER